MDSNLINIGIAIAGVIVAVCVPIAISIYSKKNKKIKCLYSIHSSLIYIKQTNIAKDIQIYYKDKLIDNISMIEIEIINNGNIPIKADEVVTPITFEFNENNKLISIDVIDKNPSSITANIYNPKNNLKTCLFDLLNPKDSIKIRFTMLGNIIGIPKIYCHIVGISKIEIEDLSYLKQSSSFDQFFDSSLFKIVLFLGIILVIIQVFMPSSLSDSNVRIFMDVIIMIYAIFFITLTILRPYVRR